MKCSEIIKLAYVILLLLLLPTNQPTKERQKIRQKCYNNHIYKRAGHTHEHHDHDHPKTFYSIITLLSPTFFSFLSPHYILPHTAVSLRFHKSIILLASHYLIRFLDHRHSFIHISFRSTHLFFFLLSPSTAVMVSAMP